MVGHCSLMHSCLSIDYQNFLVVILVCILLFEEDIVLIFGWLQDRHFITIESEVFQEGNRFELFPADLGSTFVGSNVDLVLLSFFWLEDAIAKGEEGLTLMTIDKGWVVEFLSWGRFDSEGLHDKIIVI